VRPPSPEGFRLALDLGVARAVQTGDSLNYGVPTMLLLGAAVSYRASPAVMLGVHGHGGFTSRDDCQTVECRGRAYAVGAHIESALTRPTKTFVPYARFSFTYEMVYKGGLSGDAAGHLWRHAIDFLDMRFGGEWLLDRAADGRTSRLGPYLGMVAGTITSQSGVTYVTGTPRNLDRDGQTSLHMRFTIGLRATLDP